MGAFKNIKTIFALSMVIMTIVVFSLQTGFNYYQFSNVLEEKVVELLKVQSRNEATILNNDFVSISQKVELLAQTIEAVNSYETETIVGILERIMSKDHLVFGGGFWLEPYAYNKEMKYYGPYITRNSVDGKYILTWEYSTEKYDYFQYDWYRNAFQPDVRTTWSEPYVDEVSGVAMITVTSPIKKDGLVVGVTTIDIGLERVIDYINSIKTGKSGYGFLVSRKGIPVGSLFSEQHSKIEQTESNVQRLKDISGSVLKEDGTGIMKTVLNNQEVMVVFTPVGETGLRLVMVMPVEEAFASLHWIFNFNIMGLILSVTLLTMMIFRLFDYKVAIPLQRLIKHAKEISLGNFNVIIENESQDEMGQLCKTFNMMSKTIKKNIQDISAANLALQQAHDQLEIKVEFRTQDLMANNEELQAVNQELAYTLEHLRETQVQLIQSEKMASLGNLVAGISHEINTPVGVGVTATSHLQQRTKEFTQLYHRGGLKSKDLREYLADCDEAITIVLANLGRASQLIRSFKQISVDQSSEGRRVFNIRQYLGEILLSLQPNLKRTQHKVIINCQEELQMDSFPGAFSQVITNLIMNSLIHAYEPETKGEIIIEVVDTGAQGICLTYSDDGKGMEKAVMDKIFNPFFTTRRGGGGTGLGLAIVYNIVTQQFAGRIECISAVNQGTKFVIWLPRQVKS